jgi:hypothetical protein
MIADGSLRDTSTNGPNPTNNSLSANVLVAIVLLTATVAVNPMDGLQYTHRRVGTLFCVGNTIRKYADVTRRNPRGGVAFLLLGIYQCAPLSRLRPEALVFPGLSSFQT